ncbi:5S rRNA maturation endonuclease (ribonuclease M5) [Bradyrhizobium japonicum]
MERGHEITIGPFGHAPTAVTGMIEDGIEGVLILTDDDENLEEIAARFTSATGRPIWRNLKEIPR